MQKIVNAAPFAEVIESSLTTITAQCWDSESVATFGQCVAIQRAEITVYALVYHIQTTSLDTVRKPSALKKTMADLKKEQPHIFEFLITTFTCVPLAYALNNVIIHALAPEPVRIHEFIMPLSAQEMGSVFDTQDFLVSLFGMQQQINNIDELLIACVRSVHSQKPLAISYYVELLEMYALLVGSEYRRIKLFAQRLQNISV